MHKREIFSLFRMGLFGAAHGLKGQKGFPPKILSYTFCNDETWHSFTLCKEDKKKHGNEVTHLLSSAEISISSPEISNFVISKNTKVDCINFFESLKVILINMVATFMMSANLAPLVFLKVKVFWNKGYDVIISVHDVTNKVLSRFSNYIVDGVM